MKKLLITLYLVGCCMGVMAQRCIEEGRPQRTPEEIAQKQTEMLMRDLGIDASKQDTLYKIHLKYARKHNGQHSQEECRVLAESLRGELKGLLTEKQYQQFSEHMEQRGRRPERALGRMVSASSAPEQNKQ